MMALNAFLFIFLHLNIVFGYTIIDNAVRFIGIERTSSPSDVETQTTDECPNLTSDLVKEIQAYQPIVNKIVEAVVNGKYKGDIWNA